MNYQITIEIDKPVFSDSNEDFELGRVLTDLAHDVIESGKAINKVLKDVNGNKIGFAFLTS